MATQVKSISALKKSISNGAHDFYIQLNYGLRSSKYLDYSPVTKKFYVTNEIDDTEQELTEQQLMDRTYTNIGYALQHGALYAY
jgi:uncharacterized protein YaaR (DUF327 family)